ncbi:hypothetical protein JIN84_09120 [Luteolibacter yonseiensis]|uniref:Uncharacterized protein n=1 Tax=Luteolibacter yonseiensis TaxID=1144680 RepID=A0A934R3I0_9BACT|nr:hypothetical protein [Luteolibacter yonseiensis]MBK1815777.1 hypothetical protein [Luteolibacter yonseiensis]
MRTVDDWLASEETGEAFSHCVRCRLPLVEIAEPWLVNKEIMGGECVLEYAVCQPCRDAVTAEFSEESKKSVRDFLEKEIDWDERLMEFMASHDATDRFESCIACLTPRRVLEGYGLSALFDSGGKLVLGPLPLLICLPCVGKMTASLSDASRSVWRRFLEKNFDGPPGDAGFPGML